jgi:hypothetical protein
MFEVFQGTFQTSDHVRNRKPLWRRMCRIVEQASPREKCNVLRNSERAIALQLLALTAIFVFWRVGASSTSQSFYGVDFGLAHKAGHCANEKILSIFGRFPDLEAILFCEKSA